MQVVVVNRTVGEEPFIVANTTDATHVGNGDEIIPRLKINAVLQIAGRDEGLVRARASQGETNFSRSCNLAGDGATAGQNLNHIALMNRCDGCADGGVCAGDGVGDCENRTQGTHTYTSNGKKSEKPTHVQHHNFKKHK